MNKLKVNQKVFFIGEKSPMTVMAVSERYAVVSRKLNRREDADLLHFEVERGASQSFTEAYNSLRESPVYSLLDFKEKVKAPDNYVFGVFNYFKKEDCENAIKKLENGEMELSRRNRAALNIDFERTGNKK